MTDDAARAREIAERIVDGYEGALGLMLASKLQSAITAALLAAEARGIEKAARMLERDGGANALHFAKLIRSMLRSSQYER